MLRTSNLFERYQIGRLLGWAAIVIFVSGGVAFVQAQQPGQRTFATSEQACAALVGAVQQQDKTALRGILGPSAQAIIAGGDDVEDRNSQRQFVEKYREMHRLVREPNGTITLYVGAENWPLPVVMRRRSSGYYFDTVAGRAEILYRRVGRNELATIEVCRELVKAQNEFYATLSDAGVKQFTPRFLSDEGKYNGLFWKISTQGPESPVGPLLALANTDEYANATTHPRPFHGYYFRILDRQGRHAPGGAKKYVVNGRMTGGFAFVAYPAEYRSSGVMTFIVAQDGAVYQRDLGPQTATRAKALTAYDPDATWRKVQ